MITKTFGSGKFVQTLEKFFIHRLFDGRCVFLFKINWVSFFSLQNLKPDSCRFLPFKTLTDPCYGNVNVEFFNYFGRKLYIYVDSNYSGYKYWVLSWEFINLKSREFIDMALLFVILEKLCMKY
ncbi:MAG: hypothetical protein GX638_18240 [Crenarchaeota archaeon]|nr:hypothetical protein [Thermoproteota archaeon]